MAFHTHAWSIFELNRESTVAHHSKTTSTGQVYTGRRKQTPPPCLDVGVAERSTHGAHRITDSDVSRISVSESHSVGELGCRSGGVTESDSAVDGGSPLRGVHVLPSPPHTVDLAVMEVEVWVTCWLLALCIFQAKTRKHTRRGEEVRTRVRPHSKVTSSVHAHEVVGESILSTLHVVPEGLHIRAVEELDDHLVVGPLAGGPGRDVTLQTARVVSESRVGVSEIRDWVGRSAECVGEDGAKVDRPILQGTRRHTSSSSALGDVDQRCLIRRDTIRGLVAASCITVAAHRGRGAVQSRALHRVISPPRPVVVWLVAFVTALFAQRLLVSIGKVAVPRKKVASVVDSKCLLDVSRNEVIVSVPATRALGFWCLGG
jgi:hypothetical protein